MNSDITFYIVTLFPNVFKGVFEESIVKRSQEEKHIKIIVVDLRQFGEGRHRTVDDSPYGGGKGMVLKIDIVMKALESIKPKPYTILLSASGHKYSQKKAQELSHMKNIALICGHYEGIDARVEQFVDDVLSIGDFILTGGEIPAMAVVDSVTRLIPGVIKEESAAFESFSPSIKLPNYPSTQLLEHPHYTRPEIFRGKKVPKVLLSGNHQEIEKWRKQEAIKRTHKFRPDLLSQKSK